MHSRSEKNLEIKRLLDFFFLNMKKNFCFGKANSDFVVNIFSKICKKN